MGNDPHDTRFVSRLRIGTDGTHDALIPDVM